MSVKWILRVESAAIGLLGVAAFLTLGGSPLLLVPAMLAPDLSALGYLAGPRVGAVTYNLVHNWALAVAFAFVAIIGNELWPMQVAAILAAHVGFDRALGYGLKLPSSFKDTHLGRIGREPAGPTGSA
ncbi:MAG TPA: DUF4260 domain-containing protein [Candidatus Limnocylindria bacterium]|nr:DUF4260 domain-containing protein [Candidatus Limnocylindria bacterium]